MENPFMRISLGGAAARSMVVEGNIITAEWDVPLPPTAIVSVDGERLTIVDDRLIEPQQKQKNDESAVYCKFCDSAMEWSGGMSLDINPPVVTNEYTCPVCGARCTHTHQDKTPHRAGIDSEHWWLENHDATD